MDSVLPTLQHRLETLPWWAVYPVAGVLFIAALVVFVRVLFGSKNGEKSGILSFLSEMGPQGKVALAGVMVSLYGLWGFGRDTGHLPWPIRIGFVTMFDIVELTLFGMLYKKTATKPGEKKPVWTRNLKAMHYTAWGLVVFSAWANIVHAPNAAAAPFMAMMPAAAAWVVELELRERMGGKEAVAESTTGPVKLLLALWKLRWANMYAALGVDPNGAGADLVKAAAAKRAARHLYKLRQLLEESAKVATGAAGQGRARRRNAVKVLAELEAQRSETRKLLDRADFGTDSSQGLAVMRGLAGWTRVDDAAMAKTEKADEVTKLLEEVAIMPAARKIEADGHAAAAEDARRDAERARQEAEDAKAEAEAARKDAEKATAEAEAAKAEAVKKGEELAAAAVETRRARQEAEDARQEAETARQDAETEMARLSGEADTLRQQVAEAAESVTKAEKKREELEAAGLTAAEQKDELDGQIRAAADRLAGLEGKLQATVTEQQKTADRVAEARAEAGRLEESLATLRTRAEAEDAKVRAHAERRAEAEEDSRKAAQRAAEAVTMADALEIRVAEAEGLLADLRQGIRAELPEEELESASLDGVAFPGSAAKQEAWEEYLQQVTDGELTLTAQQLSERYPVSESQARNWRVHFRARRARMVALESAERRPAGAERTASVAERTAGTAEQGVDGGRAARVPAPAPMVDPGRFVGHSNPS